MLNLDLDELISFVKKLPYFDNMVQFYVLLAGIFCLCVHDLSIVSCSLDLGLGYVGGNCLDPFEVSNRGGKYGQSNSTLNIGCKPRKGGIINSKSFSPTTFLFKARLRMI